MSSEATQSLVTWWNEVEFDGKALYSIDENGAITLKANHSLLPERTVATVTEENKEVVLKNLKERYDVLVAKTTELEVEWLATEDKTKLADKLEHLKDQLAHANALGDMLKPTNIVAEWLRALDEIVTVHYQEKLKLTLEAESLAQSTEWKETTQFYKEVADKWKLCGYVDRKRNDELWNRVEAAKNTFMDRKRAHFENEEKDMLSTLDLKIELAEKAEALANSEDWKATTEAYHNIIEQWKSIGRTLPKKNEELWQRINAAKSVFFDRKKLHFNKIQEEQEANLAVKTALVEKAESLKDSTDWNSTAQLFASMMEEWKKTGRVPQEHSEELWKRFTTAQEHFFDARRQHNSQIKQTLDNNYQQKSALLKRAEELKNSSRWGEVTQEMNQLFEDWKKIGPVPREHNNTLWDAFIAARKHFFARKDANRDQRKEYAKAMKSARTEQAYNLVMKMRDEIAQEEERFADLKNAMENITPGKKAEELRTHLEVLIKDSEAKMRRLKEKLAAGEDELKSIKDKEEAAANKEAAQQ